MSKWIIVSDNHTEKGILFEVINHHPDADVAIHLGDSEFTYEDSELSYYYKVKGNTDFYPEFENEQVINSESCRAFITHGHIYQVNRSRMQLAERAHEANCQLAFYGHTHVAKYENIAGVHVINPGSISQSRSSEEESYAELLIAEDTNAVTLNFRNRRHEIIETINFEL